MYCAFPVVAAPTHVITENVLVQEADLLARNVTMDAMSHTSTACLGHQPSLSLMERFPQK